jgi:glycosyltransferase involved in cell wall biosynthesis
MREAIRVVRIIARLNVGGPARHVVWLTAGLDCDRFSTTLVTGRVPAGEEDMTWFATDHGVEPVVIGEMSRAISWRDVLVIWKLFRLFRRIRPDIIHTHTAKAGTAGRIAGLLYRWTTHAKPRFVHTFHGHVFHGYYGRGVTAMFLMIERFLARFTDRIVVLSPQ